LDISNSKEIPVAKKLAITAAILLSLGFVVAPAQDAMMMHMKPGMQMSEADKGYMDAMQKMHLDMMKMEMTGDPTADFVRMMIPHHQSAIDMAQVLLKQQNVDPKIKTMAEKIATDQQTENDEFAKWLDEHKGQ
jgi:uncharacterized protein (DUF305 family)